MPFPAFTITLLREQIVGQTVSGPARVLLRSTINLDKIMSLGKMPPKAIADHRQVVESLHVLRHAHRKDKEDYVEK